LDLIEPDIAQFDLPTPQTLLITKREVDRKDDLLRRYRHSKFSKWVVGRSIVNMYT